MHKFQDNQGREWRIALNGWQLKKLKDQLDFDARDHESILRAAEDPALICNVLYVLCEDQAKADAVSEQAFGEALTGDAIDDATEAYLAESVDFFPRSHRPALQKLLATTKEYQTRATAMAAEKLGSPEMSQLIETVIQDQSQKISRLLAGTTIGGSSGKLQESPA
jgi:hypothetical protein